MRTRLLLGLVGFLLLMGCRNNGTLSETVTPTGSLDSTNVRQWMLTILGATADKDTMWLAWQPDTLELENIVGADYPFILDDNNYTHTVIDSSFTLNFGGKPFLLQLFSSYGITQDSGEAPEVMTCHPCAPVLGAALFEVTNNRFLIPGNYKKLLQLYGTMGAGGTVGIEKYGEDKYALAVTSSWTGQGSVFSNVTLYDCQTLREIFNYKDLDSYEGGFFEDEDESNGYAKNCKTVFSEKDGVIMLDLVCNGTQQDSASRVVSADSIYHYHFDTTQRKFITN